MKTLHVCFALAILLGNALTASAQSYSTHPIALVVPFSAGGPTDTIGRIMAERMGRSLGQTIVVENTGAIYPLQYDLLKDLEPVAMITTNATFLVSKTAVPARDLKELIAWMKLNKDKVSIGTSGPGAPAHVSAVYFKQLTNTQAQIVHYRGAAPAMQDLIAGHIDLYFDQAVTAVPNIRAGKVKAYAVTAKTRVAAAPDIPTVDEAGLPGLYMAVWHGIWAPRATPKNIVGRLNSAVIEALADPAVRKRLGDLGQDIPPREHQSPEGLGAYQRAEVDKWWPLIKAAGIKAE